MGEIAEMMLDGTLCQHCGVYLGDAMGFPKACYECAPRKQDHRLAVPAAKVKCPTCGKRVKEAGLADHQRDVHSNAD